MTSEVEKSRSSRNTASSGKAPDMRPAVRRNRATAALSRTEWPGLPISIRMDLLAGLQLADALMVNKLWRFARANNHP